MTPEALARCAQPDGPLRPTFCNVPGWGEWLLYLSGAIAIALLVYGVVRHVQVWRAGSGTVPDRNTGHARTRLGFLATYVVGQRKTMARLGPGIFHMGLFWGFVLLFIGTALATLDWDVAGLLLGTRFLQGNFYLFYELVLDAAGLAFTLAILAAMVRRYFVAPAHITDHWDFVLWSLLLINITGFLLEGLRLALAPVDWGGYSFVGQAIADLLFALAPPSFFVATLPSVHLATWLLHAVAALALLAALPYTNLAHLFSTSANAVLKTVESVAPGAALQPVDIEHAESYGVGSLAQFNWKQRLGLDSCLRCGRCETVCPAHMAGSPLNPKSLIVSLADDLRSDVTAAGAVLVDGGRVMIGAEGLVTPDALWGCTTCMACVEVCPAFIEIVDDIVDMRRHLTLMEGALPGTATNTLRNMMTAGNPWGYAPEDRTRWTDGLDVPRAEPGTHVELLYFVGCSSSYDKRNQKIARSVVTLLRAAGVSFAILEKERCNAESGRRLGEEYLYQTATEENVGNLNQLKFDRVVCHCPHCFNTIRNEYPQFGGDYEVIHHTQLIEELVAAGRLPSPATTGTKVAFHDSCYLGRYNGEFEAPRATLRAAGVDVLEMGRNRREGLCCGGGGGKMWFEAPQQRAVGEIRLAEALELKPDVVGVACPFCLTMLDSARSAMGVEGVRILDVSEVLAEALGASAEGPAAGE